LLFAFSDYDHTVSSTYATNNKPWAIQCAPFTRAGHSAISVIACLSPGRDGLLPDGKGVCSGNLSSDTVSVGGMPATSFVFAETKKFSKNFEDQQQPMDGIVGLGFQYISTSGTPTLMETLRSQGLIGSNKFSFVLQPDPMQSDGSILMIGGYDRQYAPQGVDRVFEAFAFSLPLVLFLFG
jgi:hypothetical protein